MCQPLGSNPLTLGSYAAETRNVTWSFPRRLGLQQMTELMFAFCFRREGKSPGPEADELCSGSDRTSKGREGHSDGKGRGIQRPHPGIVGLKQMDRTFLALCLVLSSSPQSQELGQKTSNGNKSIMI